MVTIPCLILFIMAWLYECAPRLIGWFYVPGYQVEYIFVSNVVTSVVTFLLLVPDMIPGLREKARHGCRTGGMKMKAENTTRIQFDSLSVNEAYDTFLNI